MDQNFMIDFEIICRIVDAAKIKTNETILEIGAGKGYLTKALAKEAKKVIAVEIDSKLKKYLKMKKVQVIIGNALENIHNLQFDKIVSNIPYSISEPLINKLIFENFKVAILTIPKGFAYIISAKDDSKKFSKLSLMTNEFYDIDVLFDVPKDAFEPRPKVSSVVIKLTPRKEKSLISLMFLQPKKLVKNALLEALCNYKKMTKSEARKAIKSFKSYNLLEKKVRELTTKEWKAMVINLKRYT